MNPEQTLSAGHAAKRLGVPWEASDRLRVFGRRQAKGVFLNRAGDALIRSRKAMALRWAVCVRVSRESPRAGAMSPRGMNLKFAMAVRRRRESPWMAVGVGPDVSAAGANGPSGRAGGAPGVK